MKITKTSVNYLLVFLIMTLVVLEVFILNFHSTSGDRLSAISREIDELEIENDRISQNIASFSSMLVVADKAKQFGLASTTKILSIGSSYPLAANLKLSL